MIAENESITVDNLRLSDEERAMSVVFVSAITWGRTTLVKMRTADNYEAVGMFTVGRYKEKGDIDPVRLTMARGNAMQRLQNAQQRQQTRATDFRAVP